VAVVLESAEAMPQQHEKNAITTPIRVPIFIIITSLSDS
jgi:hypothetical protein